MRSNCEPRRLGVDMHNKHFKQIQVTTSADVAMETAIHQTDIGRTYNLAPVIVVVH